MPAKLKELINGLRECAACHEAKPLSEFYKNAKRGHGVGGYCKPCDKVKRAKLYKRKREDPSYQGSSTYNAREKAELLRAYGGACKCCGERTPEFLAIDHIYNDGAAERREHKSSGTQFYRWLRRRGYPTNRYQLLCHNCNWAKSRYGGCPHQKKSAA